MSINDLKLRTKSLIPVAFVAVTIVMMVIFNAMQLTTISGTASNVIEHRDAAIVKLSRAARMMAMTPYSVLGALVFDSDGPAGRAAIEGFPKSVSEATALLDEAIVLAPDKAPRIGELKARFEGLVAELAKPFKIGQDTPGIDKGSKLVPAELDQMAQAAQLLNSIDMKMRGLIDDIATFNSAFTAENAQAAGDLRAAASTALTTMVAGGVAALVLAGAFSMWISSSKIAAPLARLANAMRFLSQGDLSVEISGQDRRDEIGDMSKAVQVFKTNAVERVRLEADLATQRVAAEADAARVAQERANIAMEQAEVVRKLGNGLKAAASGDLTVYLDEGFTASYAQIKDDFNAAIAQLKDAMLAVTTSANTIRSGTQEIASASSDLARRTEQQASSLEETAAALDEITATVKKSAEGAKTASEVAVAADSNAKESAVVVRNAVDAMGGIAKSSQQISQIIGVIDEIAFQTNLLALNAGVEAARAGDAGRGFAVVASEVRALAQRSAEAAKEIKGLITSSSAKVDQGVKLVVEAGRSLERITGQVTEINVIVGEIALGTREQAAGLQQVNVAVNQMDQATQQNAAMVEESTAASQSLSEETVQLATLVARFRVGASGDAGRDEGSVRRELQRVAPHAFGRPTQAEGAARRAPAARSRPKVVAANGTTGANADAAGWDEF